MEHKHLQKLFAEDPMLSERCFVITVNSNSSSPCSDINWPYFENALYSIYGKNHIEPPERMGQKVVLVTVKDRCVRNSLLASLRAFTCGHISYHVDPMTPIPARVKIRVSGIPRISTSGLSAMVLAMVSTALPFLKSMSEVKCSRPTVNKGIGYPIKEFEGFTDDMVAAKEKLLYGKTNGYTVTVRGFVGKIKYARARPAAEVANCNYFFKQLYQYQRW